MEHENVALMSLDIPYQSFLAFEKMWTSEFEAPDTLNGKTPP